MTGYLLLHDPPVTFKFFIRPVRVQRNEELISQLVVAFRWLITSYWKSRYKIKKKKKSKRSFQIMYPAKQGTSWYLLFVYPIFYSLTTTFTCQWNKGKVSLPNCNTDICCRHLCCCVFILSVVTCTKNKLKNPRRCNKSVKPQWSKQNSIIFLRGVIYFK